MNKKILLGASLGLGFLLAASEIYTSTSACAMADGTAGTLVELEMGDWSCDGHCVSKSRNICSNLSVEQIRSAYTAGEASVGIEFADVVAEEYEDSSLPTDKLQMLRDKGIATWKFEDEEYLEEGEVLEAVQLDEDSYSQIYLQITQLGNPEFKFETLQGKAIRIGGYGLFTQ